MRFFVHDDEGNIIEAGDCGPNELALRGGPGLTVREGEASPFRQYFNAVTGLVVDYDEATIQKRFAVRPGFRWSRGQWIDERSIAQAREHRWAAIKRDRLAAETGQFTVGAYAFDADRTSQTRILAAMQAAVDARTNGEPFSLEWTLADGTDVTLTRAQVITVGRRLQEHMNAQHQRAKACKAAIAAAQTVAEVEAVQW